jgi:hypothetical protein
MKRNAKRQQNGKTNAPTMCHPHKLRIVHYIKFIPKTLNNYTRRPSHIESHELEMNGGGRHSARDGLHTSSNGATYGEDVALGLPRHTFSSNGVKVDTTIMPANQRQGSESAPTNPFRNQGVHLETSLIKVRR